MWAQWKEDCVLPLNIISVLSSLVVWKAYLVNMIICICM